MPLISDRCTPIEEQHCSVLSDISQHLLVKCYEAIDSCFTGGCDGGIQAYITTGSGDDGVPDALTVALVTINPSPLTTTNGVSGFTATFEVRLKESGWPIVRLEGESIVMPQPDEQARAVEQLLSHGEAIHRRLTALKSSGKLAPPSIDYLRGGLGGLLPLPVLGGVAGWTILVDVQLPWG